MFKLSWIRKHASSWVIKFILGSIVVVFIFWGGSGSLRKKGPKVAEVNGEPISSEAYTEAYNHLMEQYRQRFGGKMNEDMIKKLNIKKLALDQLVDEKLLIQEAANLKFRVADDELIDSIAKIEAFHREGTFDKEVYRRILTHSRLTPQRFEILQKNSLLTSRVRSLIQDTVKVSDEEALEWFKWNNATISIDYVLFDPEKYKDIQPTAEEIQAYYDSHKESYKTEPKAKARFLYFSPDPHRAGITIPDDEVKEYYEANPNEFKNAKTVEARHILIKTEPKSTPDAIEKKKDKALEILKMAKDGTDFAELAKTYSEDPGSKDNGGQLGAFKKEMMVKPFAEKAFSMQPGEISDPVQTQFGWHIIKVEKINEETTLALEESKPKIIKKLTDDKAKAKAYDECDKVYDSLTGNADLAKFASDRKLNLITTELFTRKGPESGVKNRAKFASVAFDLSVNDVSEIQDLGDGYFIIQVIEKVPEQISPLTDVGEKVKADVIKQKQDEKANKDAGEFLSSLKNGKSMTEQLKAVNLTLSTTAFFKRNDSIPEIGFEHDITEAAFKLSTEKQLPENPLKGKKGYYVISFKERKEPVSEDFDKEKKSIKEQLLQQKKYGAFEAWLSEVKKRSKISYEAEYGE